MSGIEKTAAFIVLLGVLVFVHELGHFLVAKLLNVKVLKFSIGFGPRVLGFRRGETEYQVALLPLGGYVKMAGEQPYDELSPEEARRGFLAQAPWKRALIVFAGPAFNLFFPIVLLFFAFVGPKQDVSTRIGAVEPGTPAAAAGLRPGDRILRVEGKPVRTFSEVQQSLVDVYDREIEIAVHREGQERAFRIRPVKMTEDVVVEKVSRGMIGIQPVARVPVLGVPRGSPAEAAGLQTFDVVRAVNGQRVSDELELQAALAKAKGDTLALQVARPRHVAIPAATSQDVQLHEMTVPRLSGELYEALGAERADLYVAFVEPESAAADAGIAVGDRLVELDGVAIPSFALFRRGVLEAAEKPFRLTWRGERGVVTKEIAQREIDHPKYPGRGLKALELGVVVGARVATRTGPELVTVHVSPGEALVTSLREVLELIRKVAVVLARLFTLDLSIKSLGGPISIFEDAAESAERGVDTYLVTMAALSVNLGLINLLPIPILDGFHLLAAFWEAIRRRAIPIRAREIANMVGLAFLVVLMALVVTNDIMRLR
jgi:regulator of sigma E protease